MNDLFADLYELFAYFDGFSNDMFYNQLYLPIGLSMVLIPIVVLSLYYYVVNSVKLSKWWHWLILVVILCVINFGIAYSISYNGILYVYQNQNTNPTYSLTTFSFSFSMINVIWCFIISFLWSVVIKWGSTHCRRTPF